MTRRSIEFYFDFGSPASYLASTQLPAIAQEAGAALVYRPMLLGGVFKIGQTEQAVARGVFGAPTCFVDEGMFFGQDRLAFIREAVLSGTD